MVILDKDIDLIIDILNDRRAETLKNYFKSQDRSDFSKLTSISMDMWDPFINAVTASFENADKLISIDRLYVAQHFKRALDKGRAEEHRQSSFTMKESSLCKSRFHWLRNSSRIDDRDSRRKDFLSLTRMNPKTARAW